jgi:predicted RNase H-like nuclease (RuvC/YqgF family)
MSTSSVMVNGIVVRGLGIDRVNRGMWPAATQELEDESERCRQSLLVDQLQSKIRQQTDAILKLKKQIEEEEDGRSQQEEEFMELDNDLQDEQGKYKSLVESVMMLSHSDWQEVEKLKEKLKLKEADIIADSPDIP